MARSESGYIIGKTYYRDLNLTHYPEKIDSRVNSDQGYNINMRGFENIKDYNMAEHINAVSDAIISVERALGTMPYVDRDGVDRGNVGTRITLLENKDYDARYGGAGWISSQTLIGHTHTGEAGHPSRINLTKEVQGLLPKGSINLTFGNSNALTGADISVSSTNSKKLADAVDDKLSVTEGGVVQKDLEVKGNFSSRLLREWDAQNISGGTLVTDYTASINRIKRFTGKAETIALHASINNMLYGKYVIAFRLRVNALTTQEILRAGWHSQTAASTWLWKSGFSVKGTDFTAANQWQMFYFTVDMDGQVVNATSALQIFRSATTSNVNLDIDSIIMMPTHPAIYDR